MIHLSMVKSVRIGANSRSSDQLILGFGNYAYHRFGPFRRYAGGLKFVHQLHCLSGMILRPTDSISSARPRLPLIRFHGVLAPNARRRSEIIPSGPVNANNTAEDHHNARHHSGLARRGKRRRVSKEALLFSGGTEPFRNLPRSIIKMAVELWLRDIQQPLRKRR